MTSRAPALLGALLLLLAGCLDTESHTQGVVVLVDTSGSYAEESQEVSRILGYVLAVLQPGDSIAVASIGSRSFSEKRIVARATLSPRPSLANAQKKALRSRTAELLDRLEPSRHTDITGAVIQAAEYLREVGSARKTIVILSDLEEDLDGETVRSVPIDLAGMRVVAAHVIKLRRDNVDPRLYRQRLDRWRDRILAAGASDWSVINELENLEPLFSDRA